MTSTPALANDALSFFDVPFVSLPKFGSDRALAFAVLDRLDFSHWLSTRAVWQDLPEALASRHVEVALGDHCFDRNWRPWSGTFEALLAKLSEVRQGPKDGDCLTQGLLVGSERKKAQVSRNHILMLDYDTGHTIDEIEARIRGKGLAAFLWTTYSHLKSTTALAEQAVVRWMRSNAYTPDKAENLEVLKAYLASEKKYATAVTDTVTAVSRQILDGGMKLVVQHAPMHRVRALFVLKKPFEFDKDGTHVERMAHWSKQYQDFSSSLGIPCDKSCSDPSRLMYTPAVPRGTSTDTVVMRWVNGELLDLDAVSLKDDELAAFSQAGPSHTPSSIAFKTAGLAAFLKQYGKEFNAAEFLRAHAGDDIRRDVMDKVECMCPNDDAHSDAGNPEDRAFFATDAISGNGWTMHCQHDSCMAESSEASGRPDRAWFLDLCCQKYGIEHADELRQFTLSFDPNSQNGGRDASDEDVMSKIQAAISDLDQASPPSRVDDIVRRLAETESLSPIYVEGFLREISVATDTPLGTLRGALRDHRRRTRSTQDDNTLAASRREPPPSNEAIDRTSVHTIYSYWPHKEQLRVAKRAFAVANKRAPQIFMTDEGEKVRLQEVDDKLMLEDCGDSKAMWTSELNRLLTFKRTNDGVEEEVPPWDSVVTEFAGSNDVSLPVIRGVSSVPVFADDGTLVTTEGYNAKTRMYLRPNANYLLVPDAPTEEQVKEAFAFLLEPLRDFPFSDVFDGSADLPIRKPPEEATSEDFDETGFPYPNWQRGRVSRLHAVSLILLPFMRELIKGATPIHHIDKSAPGTGAGYLINVGQMILTGEEAVSGTYTANQDEFRKELLASLRRGPQALIYDNVNDRVDDPTFAQTVTSGILRGRILGQSTEVAVPIRSAWVMAGNGISFSNEMMRRICPIRMDADLPDPALERPTEFFRHKNLSRWLKENRVKLVWSCHVLIANWVAKDKPDSNGFILPSFEAWSHAMGGLFESAGQGGFMSTIKAYTGARSEEKGTANLLIARLWEKYSEGPFTSRQAYEIGCECDGNSDAGLTPYGAPEAQWQFEDIPLISATEHGRITALGSYFKKHLSGKTFRVDETMLVKLHRKTSGSNGAYHLRRI